MSSTKKGPTILVVDDDPRNVRLLEAVLRTEGYGILSASNGRDARRITAAEHPDLILMDIMMPGESGLETCELLKKDPRVSEIPVIIVSAMDDVTSKVKGFSIGAVDYITKPFEWLEVLARVRLHLKLRYAFKSLVEVQEAKLRQLQMAQQSILVKPEDFPEARFQVFYLPIMEAGGDFYDVFSVGENIYGYFVADVSGHDLGASYMTAALKALISQNATPMNTPLETMTIINRVLTGIFDTSNYLTACYLHLNRMQSKLSFLSAGHPPAVYVHAGGEVECLDGRGDILGAFEAVSFEAVVRKVSSGDRIFLYTDGLVEGIHEEKKGRTDGIQMLMEACRATLHLPLSDAVSQIVHRLSPGETEVKDDLVLLGIEA